jgi:hypothetical protein
MMIFFDPSNNNQGVVNAKKSFYNYLLARNFVPVFIDIEAKADDFIIAEGKQAFLDKVDQCLHVRMQEENSGSLVNK